MRSILCIFLAVTSLAAAAVQAESIDQSLKALTDKYTKHKLYQYMDSEDYKVLAFILAPVSKQCQLKVNFSQKKCEGEYENVRVDLLDHGIDIGVNNLKDENLFLIARQAATAYKEKVKELDNIVNKVPTNKRAEAEKKAWDFSMVPVNKLKEYGRLKG